MKHQCGVCSRPCETQDTLLAVKFHYCNDCHNLTVLPRKVGFVVCIHCMSNHVVELTKTPELREVLKEVGLPFPCADCALQWSHPAYFLTFLLNHGYMMARCEGCGGVMTLHQAGSPEALEAQATHSHLWDGQKFTGIVVTAHCRECVPEEPPARSNEDYTIN